MSGLMAKMPYPGEKVEHSYKLTNTPTQGKKRIQMLESEACNYHFPGYSRIIEISKTLTIKETFFRIADLIQVNPYDVFIHFLFQDATFYHEGRCPTNFECFPWGKLTLQTDSELCPCGHHHDKVLTAKKTSFIRLHDLSPESNKTQLSALNLIDHDLILAGVRSETVLLKIRGK